MARAANHQDQSPLHLLISEKLRKQIEAGEFVPGGQLPSEHQLIDTFNVSRITVRRAIANLVSQGLVESRRGRGVFVKEQRKVTYCLSNPMVFFDAEVARQGATNSIQNLIFELISASDSVRQTLQLLTQQATVCYQKKLLLVERVPIAVDITYTIAELGTQYAADLQRRLTFPLLEEVGIPIERIEATLECTHANSEMSNYLDAPLGSPLIVYRYVAYTTHNQPIVCGETLSRGDRLCYSVSLTKNDEL